MSDWPLRILLADEAATERLGDALSRLVRPGDVIALSGELGSGKTTLARAIIRAIAGAPVEVPSPTFTLVQDYSDLVPPVVHYDLYRLGNEDELIETGFDDADDGALRLVEWPERAPGLIPEQALRVTLSVASRGREAELAGDDAWQRRLGGYLPEPPIKTP